MPLLEPPDDIVRSYLAPGERVLHVDKPALDAFLIIQRREVLVIVVLGLLLAWSIIGEWGVGWSVLIFLALDLLVLWLVLKRLQDFYTRYVITNFRIMRVNGVLQRQHAWIPWVKVTDLSFRQSVWGRVFGYATIRIESANEQSGLKDLNDLKDPVTFNRWLVRMINAKQGYVDVATASPLAPPGGPPALGPADATVPFPPAVD